MPITPGQARSLKQRTIPQQVYEAFDELIVEQLDLYGAARFTQDTVINRILTKHDKDNLPCDRQEIFDKRWLDIESFYEDAGWTVQYRRPSYDENGSAYFLFNESFNPTSTGD